MLNVVRSLPYAARQLRNAPAFTVTAVLTLALGIGATTAIFSAVYGLLLKSLPFADAGRIVAIASTHALVPGSVEATFPTSKIGALSRPASLKSLLTPPSIPASSRFPSMATPSRCIASSFRQLLLRPRRLAPARPHPQRQ
jgi:hypothetical protein